MPPAQGGRTPAAALRRIGVAVGDALLLVYSLTWLALGVAALVGPEIGGLSPALSLTTGSLAVVLGGVIRVRARSHPAARALARVMLLFAVAMLTTGLGDPARIIEAASAGSLFREASGPVGGARETILMFGWLWLPLQPHWALFAATLHFTGVFPSVTQRHGWRRALRTSVVLWAGAATASVLWFAIDLLGPPALIAAANHASNLAIPVVGVLLVADLRKGYRRAEPSERSRILGLVAAVLVVAAGEAAYHVWRTLAHTAPFAVELAHHTAPVVALVLAMSSVLLRGALTPELVVRRTALYGVLSIAGLFAFALLDELLSELLVSKLGLPEGLGSTIAVAAIAVLMKPLHDRLSAWLSSVVARQNQTAPTPIPDAVTITPPAPPPST